MLIWRWPFLKKYILGIGLTWGLVVTTIVAYLGRIPPVMTEDLKLYNNYNFGHPYFQLYQPFHMNITIYFAGMIAGFVYHRYRESRKEFFKCQLQFNLLQVFLFLYFFTVFTGWWVVRNQSVISPILVAIYATCFKHVWGFLCTMIQIRTALATSWSRFRNFFSHPIFIILGKLCYSFYLIHFTVIVQVVGSAKQPIFYSMRAIVSIKILHENSPVFDFSINSSSNILSQPVYGPSFLEHCSAFWLNCLRMWPCRSCLNPGRRKSQPILMQVRQTEKYTKILATENRILR